MHKNLNKNKIQHAFLHCVSNYPVKLNKVGLNNIESLNKKLDCPIGYSDHSGNLIVPINSMIIEISGFLTKSIAFSTIATSTA